MELDQYFAQFCVFGDRQTIIHQCNVSTCTMARNCPCYVTMVVSYLINIAICEPIILHVDCALIISKSTMRPSNSLAWVIT